ncbi:MAG TPA: ABC transporter permease [Chryseolinea sp.]|nr:ABC transporter permease [Chryseolinea sp.]
MFRKKGHPPKLAQRILLSFLREDLSDEVLGDLEEKFYKTSKTSEFKATLNYWHQVVNYARPFAIKKLNQSPSYAYAMYQNYFKTGWRNLSHQKMYSAIKIGGFALGIATCLLIALFIRDELSYDRHYAETERIFRVIKSMDWGEGQERGVWFESPFAEALKTDFPEVEKSGRLNASELFGAGSNEIRRADQMENYYEEGFAYMDQELLEILEIPMVYGSREHALAEPNTIVISKSKADKYFPHEDPVGKLMVLNNDEASTYKIGGVMEDFPSNSHLQYQFLITLTEREFWKGEKNYWWATNYPTYVLLRPGTDPKSFEKKIVSVVKKYNLPEWRQRGMVAAEKIASSIRFELQPIYDIHLKSDGINDIAPRSSIRYVWLFGAIATFILLIAAINFINLSTAKSANRAKEVGLRKVVGCVRSNLVKQFLTESLLYSFISFVVGIAMTVVLLPYFNTLAGKAIEFPWAEWQVFPILLGALIVVGIIAGLYPSFYLSAFQPIQVLKGHVSKGSKSSSLRSTLVVFQFATSIVLIVGTIVIYRQMHYILNKEVGFNKEQVLLIQGTNSLKNQAETFKNEILALSDIQSVSFADYLPVKGSKRNGNGFWKEGETKTAEAIGGQFWRVDYDYIKTMGMKIVDGRDFSVKVASDANAVVINQKMANYLFKGDAVGKKITNGDEPQTIIGVVEDFHFETMKEEIEPLCMAIGYNSNIASVRVTTGDMTELLKSIEVVWKKFLPHQPIRYTFLDDSFELIYKDVQRMGRILITFSALAIIVACLGLFALSAFMVEQRGKEISIRLVLGASVKSIFQLLTQNFVKLIVVSFVIAVPIAWYLMDKWLQDYKYKTDITWQVFVIAGGLAVAIALLTISYQAIRAALVSPMNSLRTE